MAEPTSTAIATILGSAAAVPVLTIAGISLGLRPDVLLAGFCGSIAAMALLNTVPPSGDTVRELFRTSMRRIGTAVGSAMFAGYAAPLLALINGLPIELLHSVAFVAGAGAQRLLAQMISRAKTSREEKEASE
jgi:hypothetical protein